MSRPWSSVPSQNVPPVIDFEPGGRRLSITSSCARSYGFCGEISGARIAAITISVSSASPNMATGFARKSRTTRANGVSTARDDAAGSVDASGTAGVLIDGFVRRATPLALRIGEPHARIERRVQHVDDEIDHDEERHDDEQVSDDHRTVEHADRIDQQLSHARPREHALGHDRERDQRAELQPDEDRKSTRLNSSHVKKSYAVF